MAGPEALGGISRAMSNVNFRRYWYGMSVITVCFWAYRTALGWLTWQLTEDPKWLGFVVFTEMVPMILLGPIAGAVVDKYGSLRVGRLAQMAWALSIALIAVVTLGGIMTPVLLLVFSFGQGCLAGFSNPAHLALVAKVVPRDHISPAVALQSGSVQTGRFIGPAITGPLLVAYSPGVVFALITVGFVYFVAMLYLVRTIEPEERQKSSQGILADFKDGLDYAADNLHIRTFILFSAAMGICLRSAPELMPAFAVDIFGRGESGLAWLLAAFGLGAVFSSLWLAVRGRATGLARVFAVNLCIGALALIAFGLTANFWIALALVVVTGFGTNTVSVAGQIIVQSVVAPHMRARVMGLMGTTFRAFPALGALFLGLGASAFGLTAPIITAAMLALAAWAYFLWLNRNGALRRRRDG